MSFMWRLSEQEKALFSAEAHKEMVSFPVTTYTRQLWSTKDEEEEEDDNRKRIEASLQ